MKDVRQEFVDKGVAYVRRQFEQSAQKGRVPDTRARYLGGLVQGTLDVNQTLCRAFGAERFPLSRNFKRLIEAGQPRIYAQGGKSRMVDKEVERLWVKEQNRTFHAEEIREIALSNLARETDLILKEKIVAGPKEVDLAMLMGTGWPFFMGGLTMYLDLAGVTPKTLQKVFFGS